MARSRHPDKDIEAAVAYAEDQGWRFQKSKGHAWGRLFCPNADQSGCQVSIWSTPKNGVNHARTLVKIVDKCRCKEGNNDDV